MSAKEQWRRVCVCVCVCAYKAGGAGCKGYSEPRSLLAPPPRGMTVHALACLLSPMAFDLEVKEGLALAVP